jgi:anthranilate phosphoribosyltransferase
MRSLAVPVPLREDPDRILVDTCGTGGDGSHSLNLSTGVALLSAACGLDVVKHGNRSISSRSGSADVLESLGLPVRMGPKDAAQLVERTGFCFLFAPLYHPAMAEIMPVRRAMGVRTVFNILGPLSNPARPPFQLVGAASPELARLMAETLSGLGLRRAFVVHGSHGWDEATPMGPFMLWDVRDGQVLETEREPQALGFPRCAPDDLAGGDASYNAARLEAVLRGTESGPHRDTLVLGTALVLELCGVAAEGAEGVRLARQALDDGRAAGVLDQLQEAGRA